MNTATDHDWTSAFQDIYPDDNPTPMIASKALQRLLAESDIQADAISKMCLLNNNLKSTVFDRVSKRTPFIADVANRGAHLAQTDTCRQLGASAMLMTYDTPVIGRQACFRIHSVRTLLYWAERDKDNAKEIERAIDNLLSSLNMHPADFQNRTENENSAITKKAMGITPSFPNINIHQQAHITMQRVAEETQGSLDAIAAQPCAYSNGCATPENHARLAATHLTAKTLRSCVTPGSS